MYTPDEKKQLEQLEWQATNRHYETAIKQVVGGYVISHKTSYVSNGVILGVTTNQYIASLNGDVREVIAMLYRDDEFQPAPADYVTSPPEECATEQHVPKDAQPDEFGGLARVPEQERTYANSPVRDTLGH